MKSQTIFQNNIRISPSKGFVIVEIMIAFSVFIFFTVSTFSLVSSMNALRIWSIKELDRMEKLVSDFNNGAYENVIRYGNDSFINSNALFSLSKSDYIKAWGRNTCDRNLNFDKEKIKYFDKGIDVASSNPSTDLEVRSGIVYLTTDSNTASYPDFYIVDTKDASSPKIMSSINTGPGLSAVEVAGPYAFVAQASTINQIQILDIHDRTKPSIISQLRIPAPTPTTTLPFAKSIFYSKGYIFVGTSKWDGSEFSIIDVSNIKTPVPVGQFETGTLVNDIYVENNKAYLASSDEKQLRVLDVNDKQHPFLLDTFSPTGWQTQEGKVIDFFEGSMSFGRTVGGFNVLTNYEFFKFSSTTDMLSSSNHMDVPGGVYGVLQRPQYNFLLTHQSSKELQIFNSSMSQKIFEQPISSLVTKMACDGHDLYFSTGDSRGFSILKL